MVSSCGSVLVDRRGPWVSGAPEQLVELAGLVECIEVVESADVAVADKDLGNGAPPGTALQHGIALGRILVHLDLTEGDALALEQRLGALAVGAPASRVHDDVGFAHPVAPHLPFASAFTSGRFSA